ncbi:MAG TPA: YjgN family protein [Rhizomicrobium sp.]|nr:YjgN family protein [Rhizomicrobium sp.]
MDAKVGAAPQAPAIRHQLRFEGSGGEYFKIWIVNLALTIVTLGIFSAWAKVRSKRYFYGNTWLADYNFDYHGAPLRILLGRLIALAFLLGYSATIHFVPLLTFVWVIFFLFASPWLVNAALRFNARNSSYRNIRFNFEGGYWEAFGVYFLWGILAVITLFTLYPLARRARDHYNINNHTYGSRYFEAKIPGWPMYKTYLLAALMFIGGLMIVGVVVGGAGVAGMDFKSINPKQPLTMLRFMLLVGGAYMVLLVTLTTFTGTRVFNLALNHTVLGDRFHFESSLSPGRMIWLVISNLVLTVATLGLFYPWAAVRIARYRCEHFAVSGPDEMDNFVSESALAKGAIGEEVASFFDVDIGL